MPDPNEMTSLKPDQPPAAVPSTDELQSERAETSAGGRTCFASRRATGVTYYIGRSRIGSVISIYIHEMGHVIALRSRGIPAGAPMFIPGFGAIIQMRGLPINAIEDASIGPTGPLYGLGAALAALLIYWTTGAPIWRAIAHFAAAAFVVWIATSQVMPLAVAAVSVYRLFTKDAADLPDNVAWIQFAGLLAGLSAILVLSAR